jgi:hypothetical protein
MFCEFARMMHFLTNWFQSCEPRIVGIVFAYRIHRPSHVTAPPKHESAHEYFLPLALTSCSDFIASATTAHAFRTLRNVSNTASNPPSSNLTAPATAALTFRTLRNVSNTAFGTPFFRQRRICDGRMPVNTRPKRLHELPILLFLCIQSRI